MSKESAMIYIMDGDKLVDIQIHSPTATCPAPTQTETEIVRIFKEYKTLQAENEELKIITQALKGEKG